MIAPLGAGVGADGDIGCALILAGIAYCLYSVFTFFSSILLSHYGIYLFCFFISAYLLSRFLKLQDIKRIWKLISLFIFSFISIFSFLRIDSIKSISNNACPAGYAYVGKNKCRNVLYEKSFRKKTVEEKERNKLFRTGGWKTSRRILYFGNSFKKPFKDAECPVQELELYRNSTCKLSKKRPSFIEYE